MEAARNAVANFTSNRGHKTDVDEVVNPAVTSETIKPHRHEETVEAIDREVHQHHYHTTVQPIAHQETLPEKHSHNLVNTVEKTFRHDNEAETSQRVTAELGQFKDSSIVEPTRQTTSALPAVTGEHVHHHVHETVQPVIHKETYQPEVIHTTVPIHETHHVAAQHHGMSALPMKSLSEFTSAGGVLAGSQKHTHEEYEGAPRPYNEKLLTSIEKVLPHHSGHHGHHGHHGQHGATGVTGTTGPSTTTTTTTGTTTSTNVLGGSGHSNNLTGSSTAGPHNSNLENKLDPRVDSNLDGRRGVETGSNTTGTSGLGNTSGTAGGSNFTMGTTRPDSGVSDSTASGHKPSLKDRLNPKIDADGDGKAGFMS